MRGVWVVVGLLFGALMAALGAAAAGPTVAGAATGASTDYLAAGSLPDSTGYWMLDATGEVYAFGGAKDLGSGTASAGAQATKIVATSDGDGYWVLYDDGRVDAFGAATDYGNVADSVLEDDEKSITMAPTPTNDGYWVFTTKGRVVTFGDAISYGDVTHLTLNSDVIDSVALPNGRGYYMVAGDGGVFAFGEAEFYGSMGGIPLNQPVNGLVPDPDGKGYWLVASDGGVFAFDAGFQGSIPGVLTGPLNAPVNGMIAYGSGYLMVASDGGIFNFSDLAFHGSLGGTVLPAPIVGVSVYDPFYTFGAGTWLVGDDIEPGRYSTTSDFCYWARLSGLSGELSDIISNGIVSDERGLVEVLPSDLAFETGCGWSSWTPEPQSGIPAGTWVVGDEIVPGRYSITPTSSCYWARLSSLDGSLSSIIANEFWTSGQEIVEVDATDLAFETSCGDWTTVTTVPVTVTTVPVTVTTVPVTVTTEPVTVTTEPQSGILAGTWVVGDDIEPGRYSTTSDFCYWARLSGLSGELGDIISNGIISDERGLVEVLPSDLAFETGCGWSSWTAEPQSGIPAGTWVVGDEIVPGRYSTTSDFCYWARLSGLSGELGDIISNGIVSDERGLVEVLPSDLAFETGCGWSSWTAEPQSGIPAGTWVVGDEIVPGRYSITPTSSCYWARLTSLDGSLSSIIANEFWTSGQKIVDIDATDLAFETTCGDWEKIG